MKKERNLNIGDVVSEKRQRSGTDIRGKRQKIGGSRG